jgi:TerC family integral membrane protein
MSFDTIGSPALWVGFVAFVLAMLAIDLGVFHRKAHAVSLKEAGIWSAVWVALALLFNLGVYLWFGRDRALEFTTGYLIEKALAVDNLFVFAMIFAAFAIPPAKQHRVLFWGVLGALAMRAGFIFAGGARLQRFHWTMYVFGALLAFMGVKLLAQRHEEPHPDRNVVVRAVRKVFGHGRLASPMLLALITIEITDLVFAMDSIPAIFAVTDDPFIVFTSNIFAILGLRSLYFLLAGVLAKFAHLKVGLAFVLMFVGAKMLLVDVYKVPIGASLAIIGGILGISLATSVWSSRPRLAGRRRVPAGL